MLENSALGRRPGEVRRLRIAQNHWFKVGGVHSPSERAAWSWRSEAPVELADVGQTARVFVADLEASPKS
jgi:hypothetical protein